MIDLTPEEQERLLKLVELSIDGQDLLYFSDFYTDDNSIDEKATKLSEMQDDFFSRCKSPSYSTYYLYFFFEQRIPTWLNLIDTQKVSWPEFKLRLDVAELSFTDKHYVILLLLFAKPTWIQKLIADDGAEEVDRYAYFNVSSLVNYHLKKTARYNETSSTL